MSEYAKEVTKASITLTRQRVETSYAPQIVEVVKPCPECSARARNAFVDGTKRKGKKDIALVPIDMPKVVLDYSISASGLARWLQVTRSTVSTWERMGIVVGNKVHTKLTMYDPRKALDQLKEKGLIK